MAELIVCRPKFLPTERWVSAAQTAIKINPFNRAAVEHLTMIMPGFAPTPQRIAALTTKYWHSGGVTLTVGFMDSPPPDLRARILQHMNAWNKTAKVAFTETNTDPQVRIARNAGDGYWSYIGTDILSIPANQPTMNLDSFSMNTIESEYHRVVRHETGHTMGFIHEHMRSALVAKIDPQKAYTYFLEMDGWTKDVVDQQVLTPIEESSLTGTNPPDPDSIMCYQLPGTITKDGQPIVGGLDIDDTDYGFAATLYPK
jgi:Astacin (Peptidase family M12A)